MANYTSVEGLSSVLETALVRQKGTVPFRRIDQARKSLFGTNRLTKALIASENASSYIVS